MAQAQEILPQPIVPCTNPDRSGLSEASTSFYNANVQVKNATKIITTKLEEPNPDVNALKQDLDGNLQQMSDALTKFKAVSQRMVDQGFCNQLVQQLMKDRIQTMQDIINSIASNISTTVTNKQELQDVVNGIRKLIPQAEDLLFFIG